MTNLSKVKSSTNLNPDQPAPFGTEVGSFASSRRGEKEAPGHCGAKGHVFEPGDRQTGLGHWVSVWAGES